MEPITKRISMKNELGMHLRAAGRFVDVASKFKARITITRDGREVDGKSVMGVLSLAVPFGGVVDIKAVGDDAAAAMDELIDLIDKKFYETK